MFWKFKDRPIFPSSRNEYECQEIPKSPFCFSGGISGLFLSRQASTWDKYSAFHFNKLLNDKMLNSMFNNKWTCKILRVFCRATLHNRAGLPSDWNRQGGNDPQAYSLNMARRFLTSLVFNRLKIGAGVMFFSWARRWVSKRKSSCLTIQSFTMTAFGQRPF